MWLFIHAEITSCAPSAAYMRQGIGLALVPIMACGFFGAMPLSKPMLFFVNCTIRSKLQWNINFILTYGSDVWGISRKGLSQLDKVFLHYARCVSHVKSTTCNTIIYGECGQFPPSVFCQINTLCFLNRVENAQEGKIVKLVFEELRRLGDQGFQTWISKAYELANSCGLDSDMIACADKKLFKRHCKEFVMKKFVNRWQQELTTQTKPILRTYSLFKNDFFHRAPFGINNRLQSLSFVAAYML